MNQFEHTFFSAFWPCMAQQEKISNGTRLHPFIALALLRG